MRRALTVTSMILGGWVSTAFSEEGTTIRGPSDSAPTQTAPRLTILEVAGVYAVRQDKPFDPRIYDLDIAGVSLRTYWKNIEPERGQFNWSLFDDAVEHCAKRGKKVRLCIMFGLGVPKWVDVSWFTGSPDSEYDTANKPMPVPWNENLIREQKRINRVFAERYRDNPTVSFFHISGPSSIWEELALPKNIVEQEGYSQEAILNAWKQVIDQWKEIRGCKRLSCAVSAATSVYRDLGDDIARYAVGDPKDPNDHGVIGPDFVLQWNYLDTLYGPSILDRSRLWIPKTSIAWQMWGSTAWKRKCQDYEGTVKLAMDVGSTYVEVYQEDLLIPQYARFTEAVHREVKARVRKNGKAFVAIERAPPKPTRTDVQDSRRAPELLDRPYVPLMTLMGGGPLGHVPSDEELATIAKTYQFVNSHGGMVQPRDPQRGVMAFWAGPSGGVNEQGRTIGERIKSFNPNFTLSNYRNGSYVSQNCPNEAKEVESRLPLGIAVWNTGAKLQKAASADDTEILLSSTREIPKGMPQVYPFKASTTQAEHSRTPREYVAWIRLGDEIIRIDSVTAPDAETIRMDVRRGLWGTTAAAHGTEEFVLQPIYIGASSGIAAADGYLSGRPDTDAPQLGLRYALDQSNPELHRWLGDKCESIFSEGYDVVWLDVSASTWYNNANAYGTPVVPWNIGASRLMDNSSYVVRQQLKLDALFERFPDKQFFVNNVKGGCYFDHGQERRLLSGDGGHYPASGGSMEMYANTRGERAWQQVANMTLDFVRSGFWGVAWSKGSGGSRYRQFAYGTFLMAYDPDSRLLFGAAFGGVKSRPNRLFYWDLGEPLQRFRRINEARHGEVEGVYCRDFTKGKVLVHPTPVNAISVKLSREYYDPDSGRPVREVRLDPFTAKILLILPTD